MQQHLKLFANHTAYNAVKDLIDTPNVVLCLSENEVHFNPISPTTNLYWRYYEANDKSWLVNSEGAAIQFDMHEYGYQGIWTGLWGEDGVWIASPPSTWQTVTVEMNVDTSTLSGTFTYDGVEYFVQIGNKPYGSVTPEPLLYQE